MKEQTFLLYSKKDDNKFQEKLRLGNISCIPIADNIPFLLALCYKLFNLDPKANTRVLCYMPDNIYDLSDTKTETELTEGEKLFYKSHFNLRDNEVFEQIDLKLLRYKIAPFLQKFGSLKFFPKSFNDKSDYQQYFNLSFVEQLNDQILHHKTGYYTQPINDENTHKWVCDMIVNHENSCQIEQVSKRQNNSKFVNLKRKFDQKSEQKIFRYAHHLFRPLIALDSIYFRGLRKIDFLKAKQKDKNSNIKADHLVKHILYPNRPIVAELESQIMDSYQIKTSAKDLCTIIINCMVIDEYQYDNLRILLKFFDEYYHNIFEIIILEQGLEPNAKTENIAKKFACDYFHLYNDSDFNRGWGFNYAALNISDKKVMVFLDLDILPSGDLLNNIIDCYLSHYNFISPYKNVYFTSEQEKTQIANQLDYAININASHVRKSVTISGGSFIANRRRFIDLGGYEQYFSYGGEDRAFDSTLLHLEHKNKINIANFFNMHLHHPDKKNKTTIYKIKQIMEHVVQHYQNDYDPSIKPDEYIYSKFKVNESNIANIRSFSTVRKKYIGQKDLYNSEYKNYINCIPLYDEEIDCIQGPSVYVDHSRYQLTERYGNYNLATTDKIRQLHNKHYGERCFIIGNGPSLNKHDLLLLENEVSFGVNGIFYKTEETGFRPKYYVVEDTSVMKENLDEIVKYKVEFKFFPTLYRNLIEEQDNVIFFNMNGGYYQKSSLNHCLPRFSSDMAVELFCGQSVTIINLQMALYMGFKEVYLIGMDFSYEIPKEHIRNNSLILSTTDDHNHFHKDYFGKGKTWKDPRLDKVLKSYEMCKIVYEARGAKIFNASIGGKLEVFDRTDYNSLF